MEEKDIIEKILKGDTRAFALLIERYEYRVFSLVQRLSGSRENAEELTQDIFVKVYTNLATFNGQSKFSTWLYRIAYNTTISDLRAKKKLKNEKFVDDWQTINVSDLVSLLEPLKHEEQKRFLKQALEQLNAKDRFLVESFYLEELKISEISDITGDNEPSLKVRLHRVRKKLYNILIRILDTEYKELY